MLVLVIAFLGALFAGTIASGKRRSGFGWGVAGFFFGLIAVLIVLALPPLPLLEDVIDDGLNHEP